MPVNTKSFCLLTLLMCLISFSGYSENILPSSAWQITVSRIDPSPQPSGSSMRFRLQLQCSAVSGNVCLDSEIRFPDQGLTRFELGANHPAIDTFIYDNVTNEWVIDLQDEIFTGTNIEFDIIAKSYNNTTPDGTTFVIDATISSSNTDSVSASDTGSWSATANLGIEKYLQYGPDTDGLLDVPIRYYLYPCDPSYNYAALGNLYLDNWTITDELPDDVIYNNSSGTYDAVTNTVTWSDTEALSNTYCDFSGGTDYWVEVTYPSSIFGSTASPAILEVENTATFEAYPIGEAVIPANRLFDTDVLQHGFTDASAEGRVIKRARTPYTGVQTNTFEGDAATFEIAGRTQSSSTIPYYWRLVDPLPCLDSVSTNGTQYYSQHPSSSACANPAFQPTDNINLKIDTRYVSISDNAAFGANNPTIPLEYIATDGSTGSMQVPLQSVGTYSLIYEISWAEVLTQIAPAIGISNLTWDSESIGVLVPVISQNNRIFATMTLNGEVAEDTPTYSMLPGYRLNNRAYFYADNGNEETLVSNHGASVSIIARLPILTPQKTVSESSGLVTLTTKSVGGTFQDTDSLIVADLLPLGYTFNYESQQYIQFGSGNNWYWINGGGDSNGTPYPELDNVSVRNNIDVEVIDDYNGTGRQLVRATFLTPPLATGWEGMTEFRFSFYLNQRPMNYTAVNDVLVFPTHPLSVSDLQCQRAVYLSPTNALSSDPDDLDGDGLTSGDSYCTDPDNISPTSTIVDLQAYKSVRGDDGSATDFEDFPAIAGITDSGGSVDFQVNVQNVGGVVMEDFVIYDILPHVGDIGLSETQLSVARGSQFDASFTGIDMSTVPAGAVIEYSVSTNPCRDELTTGATPFPTGCVDDWTIVVPSPIENVKALRFTFPAGDLSLFDPGEAISIEYSSTYPAGVNIGDVAWNNFAYAGTRNDDGTDILPTEAPKVGIGIPEVDLNITKTVSPTTVLVNNPVEYTVIIDHQGNVTPDGVYTLPAGGAKNVTIQDNFLTQGLILVPGSSYVGNTSTNSEEGATFNELTGEIFIPSINANDTYQLTYLAYSTVEGSVDNTIEIMSHPGINDSDSTPGNGIASEDDIDTATANWVVPSIDLQKLVETTAGSGVFIEADATDGLEGEYAPGEPVTYRFEITNTGSTYLSDVTISDDLVGFECDQNTGGLFSGESRTVDCTWSYGFAYDANPYINTATVSGRANIDGENTFVTDTDSAQIVICTLPELASMTNQTLCANGTVLPANVTTSVTNGIAVTYQWYNDLGLNNPNTTIISGQTSATLTDLPTTAGTYQYRIEATSTSSPMCKSSASVTLVLTPNPDVMVNKSDEHCDQNDGYILLTIMDDPNQSQIQFSIDNGVTYPYVTQDNNTNFSINNLNSGTYDVWARWGDDSCPIGLGPVTIDDVSGPTVNTSGDDVVCITKAITINATASNGTSPYFYSWDNGLGSGSEKTIYPSSTTTYNVTATDNFGCTDTDALTITVLPDSDPACSDCADPTDADNDGICASEDCDDNDPALPLPAGSGCDDANAFTANDVIQSDGCGCEGRYIDCTTTLIVDLQQPIYNDNSTPGDLTDDTFTFLMQINGNGATGWTADGQSGSYGQTVNFGPYGVDAAGITIDVIDQDNPNCSEQVSVNISSCIYSGGCTCCE